MDRRPVLMTMNCLTESMVRDFIYSLLGILLRQNKVLSSKTTDQFNDITHEMMNERQTLHQLHEQERALQTALDVAHSEQDESSSVNSVRSSSPDTVSSEGVFDSKTCDELATQLAGVRSQIKCHLDALRQDGNKRDRVMADATGLNTRGTVGEEISVDAD